MRKQVSLLLASLILIFAATGANAQAAPKAKRSSPAKNAAAPEPSPEALDATIAAHRKAILSKINTPPPLGA